MLMTYEVIHGDCLEVLPTLAGRYDAVLTDPPYGIAYSSGYGSAEWGDGAIEGDEDTRVRDAALQLTGEVPSLVFGTWKRPYPVGTRALLVWDTLGALGMGDLRIPWKPSHQQIYVLGDPNGFVGPRGSDVISHPPVQSMAANGRVHPFEKPVGLMKMLLCRMRATTVLDPFCGSGPVGVACAEMGLNFIGIETSAKYVEIARRRIADAVPLWSGVLPCA